MRVFCKDIAVAILIFAAVLLSNVESACPSKCNCTEKEVFCVKKNLDKIPNFDLLDNNPMVIDLSGNKIAMIGAAELSFEKSEMIKEMYLNSSEINDIDSEAFDDMENLQELYLGDNLLNIIPEDFIEDLPNMLLLDLSGNPFEGNMPIIRSESLEMLVLVNCHITDVSAEALKYLTNLKFLLLHENNIQYINPEVFEDISPYLFVRLSYNTWKCDCKTMELFNYLSEKKYIDLTEPYQCITDNNSYVNILDFLNVDEYRTICNISYMDLTEENDRIQNIDKRNLQINPKSKVENAKNDGDNIIFEKEQNVAFEEERRRYAFAFKLSLIASLISFLIGLFFGFFLHQCTSAKNQLETSDSTSKLITSSS